MPVVTHPPVSTAVVAAGWNNPTNAYTFDNTYADSTTNNAEQSYDYQSFHPELGGAEIIDKVFVKIKWYHKLTGVLTGDDSNLTFTVKVYDGSSWTSYVVGYDVFSCTTANDESFTDTVGSNSIQNSFIDVTSVLNTHLKLNSAQTSVLIALTADAGLTPQIYVDAIHLVVCYHYSDAIPITTGAATTKKELEATKEIKALTQLRQYLKATS